MNRVIGINDAESSGSHTHPPTYLSHLDVCATASANNETMQNKETSNIFFHQLLYNSEYFNSNIVNTERRMIVWTMYMKFLSIRSVNYTPKQTCSNRGGEGTWQKRVAWNVLTLTISS